MDNIEFPKLLFIKLFKYLQYNYESREINEFKIYKLIRVLNRDYRDNIAPKFKYERDVNSISQLQYLTCLGDTDREMLNISMHVYGITIEDWLELLAQNSNLVPKINSFYFGIHKFPIECFSDHSSDKLPLFLQCRDSLESIETSIQDIHDISMITEIFKDFKRLKYITFNDKKDPNTLSNLQSILILNTLTNFTIQSVKVTEMELKFIIEKTQHITTMVIDKCNILNDQSYLCTSLDLVMDSLSMSKVITNFKFNSVYTYKNYISLKCLVFMLNTNTILKHLFLEGMLFTRPVEDSEDFHIYNNTLHTLDTLNSYLKIDNINSHMGGLEFYWNTKSNLKTLNLTIQFTNPFVKNIRSNFKHFKIQSLVYNNRELNRKMSEWEHLVPILRVNIPTLTHLEIISSNRSLKDDSLSVLFKAISKCKSLTSLDIKPLIHADSVFKLTKLNLTKLNLNVSSQLSFYQKLALVIRENVSIKEISIKDTTSRRPIFEFIQSILSLISHAPLTSISFSLSCNLSNHTDEEIDHLYSQFESTLRGNLYHLTNLNISGLYSYIQFSFKYKIDIESQKYLKFINLLHQLFLIQNTNKL
ncbi:hypothetical protein DLAC_08414 [Tieghemostelium lacteum]|uniref:Uncharacterized protein n=1 Tax=Tieghemostelium lacteum TaxID=361077 RepID=A0A151ZBX3_TIELA|nr:hypothetical protein DLAC_08414 [Tieghemostelium lacteum]|eukprot:KYQ91446.1 hypothetical protein DLAC_08414 [Tieghemostelium lacteum]